MDNKIYEIKIGTEVAVFGKLNDNGEIESVPPRAFLVTDEGYLGAIIERTRAVISSTALLTQDGLMVTSLWADLVRKDEPSANEEFVRRVGKAFPSKVAAGR